MDYHKPILLHPSRLDVKDRIDLWYKLSSTARLHFLKRLIMLLIRAVKIITGVTLVPTLSLAIKKGNSFQK